MSNPHLVFATPNGQTAVRVVFDSPMRELGATAPEDPQNPALWTVGGGLPAVTQVVRLSPIEYELVLATAAPLAGGYSVTIALTAQSAAGELVDPAFVTAVFAVTVADLRLVAVTYPSAIEIDFTFSEAIALIEYDAASEVATIQARDSATRVVEASALNQSGSTLRLTLENAGTQGAVYDVRLNRQVIVSQATSVVLKFGDQSVPVHGQGELPEVLSLVATETTAQLTSSQVLNETGWPLALGLYEASAGSLGSALTLGDPASILRFGSAAFTLGASVTVGLRQQVRTNAVGVSLTAQATSVLGAGTEAFGAGTTTLSKTAGAPYELVFSGSDSFTFAGRRLSTTLEFTFPLSGTTYPLATFTFLSSQVSVQIVKTTDNRAALRVYRGQNLVGEQSRSFDPTVPFAFAIVDATAEAGYLAVLVDGAVLAGAAATALVDPLLTQMSAGVTAFALTLGTPVSPALTFSMVLSTALETRAFTSTGLLGSLGNDLLSFDAASQTAVVAISPSPPLSSGFANTGAAAFSVFAEYAEDKDAVSVVIGLSQAVLAQSFTGSTTLLTNTGAPVDQLLLTNDYVLVTDPSADPEIVCFFLHPKQCYGMLVAVSLDIDGETYSATVPVATATQPFVLGKLTRQPARWYHPRLVDNCTTTGAEAFGPSAIAQTPN